MSDHVEVQEPRENEPTRERGISRRGFLASAGAAGGALLPALAGAQAPALTKDALRPVVDAAELSITDQQLAKLAGAVNWGRGELRKLREVDVGLGGPAPVFLPAAPTTGGGEAHE